MQLRNLLKMKILATAKGEIRYLSGANGNWRVVDGTFAKPQMIFANVHCVKLILRSRTNMTDPIDAHAANHWQKHFPLLNFVHLIECAKASRCCAVSFPAVVGIKYPHCLPKKYRGMADK
jgi:hypothetical protein